MVEDLTPFFDDLGTPALLGGQPVRGLFDSEYLVQDLGSGMASTSPAYTLPSSSVPAPVVGVALVVGGVSYKVVESKPDGTGVTVLRLRA